MGQNQGDKSGPVFWTSYDRNALNKMESRTAAITLGAVDFEASSGHPARAAGPNVMAGGPE